MKRIKAWVNDLSMKKKLVFYGYITIAPVLIVICIGLLFYNYAKAYDEKMSNDISDVQMLSDNVGVLQTDIKDISTYYVKCNDQATKKCKRSH